MAETNIADQKPSASEQTTIMKAEKSKPVKKVEQQIENLEKKSEGYEKKARECIKENNTAKAHEVLRKRVRVMKEISNLRRKLKRKKRKR